MRTIAKYLTGFTAMAALSAPVGAMEGLNAADLLTTPALANNTSERDALRAAAAPVTRMDVPDIGAALHSDSAPAAINATIEAIHTEPDVVIATPAEEVAAAVLPVVSAAPASEPLVVADRPAEKPLLPRAPGKPIAGCRPIVLPSGIGHVAVGSATYSAFANPDATRMDKHQAYQKAFLRAKAILSKTLNGYSLEAKEALRKDLQQLVTGDATKVNMSEELVRTSTEAVQALLRGYVVYDVTDDIAAQTVTVSIITSAETRAAIHRLGAVGAQVQTISEGIDAVIAEVKAGVVPEFGGKFITIPGGNETALVTFASSVVAVHDKPQVQAELRAQARALVRARAAATMVAMAQGDYLSWRQNLTERQQKFHTEFTPATATEEAVVLEAAQDILRSSKTNSEMISAVTKGQVPPGVSDQVWEKDGVMYAILIYTARAEREALQAAQDMQRPVQPAGPGEPAAPAADGAGAPVGPAQPAAKGPSGQVTPDSDL